MPSSRHEIIPHICQFFVKLDPLTALDIGVGSGKYGMLFREYTDLWRQRRMRPPWTRYLVGVEPWSRYLWGHHANFYDRVVSEQLPAVVEPWELAWSVATLEHMTPEQGHHTLQYLKEHAQVAVVTVPENPGKQGPVFGNPYEEHRSRWTRDELSRYGKVKVIKARKPVLMLVMEANT